MRMLEDQLNLEFIGLEDDNENSDEEDLNDDDNAIGIRNGEYELIAATGFNATDRDKRISG